MTGEKNHYFIEFSPTASSDASRLKRQALCRQMAEDFIGTLKEWAGERRLEHKIGSFSVTAFGQLQIACEQDVIEMIREQDVLSIAAIRQSSLQDVKLKRFADIPRRKSA